MPKISIPRAPGMSDRIREARLALNMKTTSIAAALDLRYETWSRYEHGRAAMGDSVISMVEYKFGVSAAWLTQGTEPMFTALASQKEEEEINNALTRIQYALYSIAWEVAGLRKRISKRGIKRAKEA